MTPLRPLTSYFGHRPLALLPSLALAPYANTKRTDSGVVPNTERRVAVIPVVRMLVHGPSVPELEMQSYNDVTRGFFTALESDQVDAIALAIDSPEGEIAGCFDAADSSSPTGALSPSQPSWTTAPTARLTPWPPLATASAFPEQAGVAAWA